MQAAYAANPIPELPPSAFNVRGGLQFASDDHPGFWNADTNNIQPRAGFAYQLTPEDRGPRRRGRLHRSVHHQRQHPAWLLAEHAVCRVGRSRADLPRQPGKSVSRRRARSRPAHPRAPTRSSVRGRPVRAARFQNGQNVALHRQRPARAAGAVAARGRIRRQQRATT